MCGIFAAINFNNLFLEQEINSFKEATNLVTYRGPNGFGYGQYNSLNSDFPNGECNVFLGHRRLSIIDLSEKANQPMEDNGNYIIFNGEIFNYIELREDLKRKGIHFNSDSDTEVILKLYDIWGESSFAELNGMFSFIIYNSKEKKIIVCRDRFSMKPLFYTQNKETIYFASEIKQLKKYCNSDDLNIKTTLKFLKQNLLDIDDDTFYQNIQRVPAKNCMIINMREKEIINKTYWNYSPIKINNYEEAQEQFYELFLNSIKIRLRSDVKLGALLSGGLDSSAICTVADEFSLSDNKMQTFSIITDDKRQSEEKYVDLLVASKAINNVKLLFKPESILTRMDEVIYHQDEPFGSFSVIAQYCILEMIRKYTNIIVVLSGQGGDEVLMGYLRYYFFNLRNNLLKLNVYNALKELMSSIFYRTVITQFELGKVKKFSSNLTQKHFMMFEKETELEPVWNYSDLNEYQKYDIDKYSIPILTRYEDRNSMAHSLETRHPFLDHRLVNFSLSLKIEYKLKNGWTKYILRKTMEALPREIRWRKDKNGFDISESKILKNALRSEIESSFKKSILTEMGIVKKNSLMNYWNLFLEGKKSIHFSDISKFYITERWLERNYGN